MKTKLLLFSSLSLLTISQFSFLNSKNVSFINTREEMPYVPYSDDATTYSGKSFDLVDQNNSFYYDDPISEIDNFAMTYFQVIDNSTNDYFNYVKSLESTYLNPSLMMTVIGNTEVTQDYYNSSYFYPSLSNIKRNGTYYIASKYEISYAEVLNGFVINDYSSSKDVPLQIGNPEIAPEYLDVIYSWEDINNSDDYQKSSITNYQPTNTFPYISPYDEINNDVFQMNNYSNDELTFTIKVNNWTESTEIDYLTKEQNIGVTLINQEESDEYLKYEQFNADLVSNEGEYYTYKISGLTPDIDYTFYSINFTGLTIGNITYLPDVDITLEDDLNVPSELTNYYANPFIDPTVNDVFSITKVESTSIEFSLKIVDTIDHKYLNYLNTEDNTMDVTLMNYKKDKKIETDAVFIDETNNIFTFRINGLDNKTNYEFISLNNTNLMINGEIDDEILIGEELPTNDIDFRTTSKYGFPFLIVLIVSAVIVVGIIILAVYFFVKKNKKGKVRKQLKNILTGK